MSQHIDIEEGLNALDQATANVALIEASTEWQDYLTELEGAKRAYENAVNALKATTVYVQHEQATKDVADADTALRKSVVAWWKNSDKSQKSIGRVAVRISTKYAVTDNVAFIRALQTAPDTLVKKLVKKVDIEQSVAESATLLDIPLTTTETVTAVVKGAK